MRLLNLAVVCCVLMAISGCIITVEDGGNSSGHVGYESDAATIAEIDAAAKLTFDDGKRKAFVGIASRPHLSGHAQVYLVKKSMQTLTFDDSKRDVLLALVNNPYFVAEGKKAVLDNLDALTFDNSKQEVLEAINRRGYVPTERQLKMRPPEQMQPQQEEEATKVQTQIDVRATYGVKL